MLSKEIFKVPVWILLLCLVNAIPILYYQYFTTDDGGPHLYNSVIILDLLFNSESPFTAFFKLNSLPVPNWTGHLILTAFNSFLPGWMAEKILQLSYIMLLPLSFRWMLKSFSENVNPLWLLIFPFCFSFNFYCGFYNFCIGMLLVFFVIGKWKRSLCSLNFKTWVHFFLLFLLLYLTHLFVFGLTLIAGYFLLIISLTVNNDVGNGSERIKYLIRTGLFFVTAALPGLALSVIYFSGSGNAAFVYLSKEELWNWLYVIRPLVVFGFHLEPQVTRFIFILIVSYLIYTVYCRVSLLIKDGNRGIRPIELKDTLLVTAITLLVMFFVLPDSDGRGGYISLRLSTLFYLFLIAWLSLTPIPGKAGHVTVLVILACMVALIGLHIPLHSRLNRLAQYVVLASKSIPSYSTVVQVKLTDFWMENHYASYAAADKPLVLLDNYEADVGYFPVLWNEGRIPEMRMGNINRNETCVNWKSGDPVNGTLKVDYYLLFGQGKEIAEVCHSKIISLLLQENYELVFNSPYVQLYKRKR